MWPEPVERVARELRAAAVDATIQELADGSATAEDAAKALGVPLEQIVKSIVFVCDADYVLVLVPGNRRADEESVAAALEVENIRIASAAEVLEATGFEPGGVAPFPLANVASVLLEQTLLQHSRVWVGAGSPAHMAELSPVELERLSGARAADVSGPR